MKYTIPARRVWIFKSEKESIVASWLNELKLPYLYEPETYQTKVGKYTPDFYLPQINTYIEVKPKIKGFIEESYIFLLKEFAREKQADLIILSPREMIYLELNKWGLYNGKDPSGYVIHCSKCKKKSFTSNTGIYYCRHCGNHNGDHDCKETILESCWGYSL